MLAGFCVTMAPFVESYFFLMVLCNGYGFFISANYVLASVITVHILCLYEFQTGYGLLCLVEGLGNLIGPALVGMFSIVFLRFNAMLVDLPLLFLLLNAIINYPIELFS